MFENRIPRNSLSRWIRLLVVVLCFIPRIRTVAQDLPILLSADLPEFFNTFIDSRFFTTFEEEHPGVRVTITYKNTEPDQPPAFGIEKYLNAIKNLAESADVVFVSPNTLSNMATRSGFFLDMASLVKADSSLNVDDYYPAMWKSFQWDGGVWALPLSGSINLLLYHPQAFDKLGIAYPSPAWSLTDFSDAARQLSADNGFNEKSPAFFTPVISHLPLLLRSVSAKGFSDDSQFPSPPQFGSAELRNALQTVADLQSREIASFTGPMKWLNQAAMTIGPASQLYVGSATWEAGALLPGGSAGLVPNGFAISAGTQYPELAYDLAKYITNSPKLAYMPGTEFPARRSMGDNRAQDKAGALNKIPDRLRPLLEQAIEQAVPLSELRYSDYLYVAFSRMTKDGLSAEQALQEVEEEVLVALQTAEHERGKISIIAPVAQLPLAPGKRLLRFGISTLLSPLPNREQWDQFIADFIAGDPRVSQVELDTDFLDRTTNAQSVDCFYLSDHAMQSPDPPGVLDLAPLVAADASFDEADFVAGILAQLASSNRLLGYPIVLHPTVLWYDAKAFGQANLPFPEQDWTVSDFTNVLQALQERSGNSRASLGLSNMGNTPLLMLIAAYGGLPFDYRTNPPTIRFTEPATLSAIQEVLDLAKRNLIHYERLVRSDPQPDDGAQLPLYADVLNELSYRYRIAAPVNIGNDSHRLTLFPRGSAIIPVSYALGTAYIDAQTPDPEACYRWIKALASHSYLLSGMPVRSSLMNDAATTAVQGPELINLYRHLAQIMADPKTVVFPGRPSSLSGALPEQTWLNRAFDNYVLNDRDLAEELIEAERFVTAYRECVSHIPPYDPNGQEGTSSIEQLNNCAIKVDPTFIP